MLLVLLVSSSSNIHQKERDILVEFYKFTSLNTRWTASDGWLDSSADHCSWFGITCSNETLRVIGLELPGNNLSGPLPGVVGQLQELTKLDLSSNLLEEEINSTHFANLPNLEVINLGTNQLTGVQANTFTNAKFQRLSTLDLSLNPLGGLPDDFAPSLANRVDVLILWQVDMSQLPENFGTLKGLHYLDLSFNTPLSGVEVVWGIETLETLILQTLGIVEIPDDLSHLENLIYLDLWQNGLTEFPKGLLTLKKLNFLALAQNYIGSMPQEFDTLQNMQVLYAWDCALESVPRWNFPLMDTFSVAANPKVQTVDISGMPLLTFVEVDCEELIPNDLRDTQIFSLWIQGMPEFPLLPSGLLFLYTWDIPATVLPAQPQLNQLARLYLSAQSTPLLIEQDLFNISSETIWRIKIDGDVSFTIPSSLELPSLNILLVQNSPVTGTLPTELALSTDLEVIDLENCPGITGTLPTQLASLPLSTLMLTNTSMEGEIPPEFFGFHEGGTLETCLLEQDPPNEFFCWSDKLLGSDSVCNIECQSTQGNLVGTWINDDSDQCKASRFGNVWTQSKLEITPEGRAIATTEFKDSCKPDAAKTFSFKLEGVLNATSIVKTGEQQYEMEIDLIVDVQQLHVWSPTSATKFMDICQWQVPSLNQVDWSKYQFSWFDFTQLSCPVTALGITLDLENLRLCPLRHDKWFVNFANATLLMGGGVFLGFEPSSNCDPEPNRPEIKTDIKYRRDWECPDPDDVGSCEPKCGDAFAFAGEECDSVKGCSNCVQQQGWNCGVTSNSTSVCQPICGDHLVVSSDDCDSKNHNSDDNTNTIIIIIVVVIGGVILIGGFWFIFFFKKNQKQLTISGRDLVLEEVIGEGHFGKVYKGTWRGNTLVAVKSLKQSEHLSKQEIHQFTEEARLFMNVPPHPNIVQFLGLCFEKCETNISQLEETMPTNSSNLESFSGSSFSEGQPRGDGEMLKIITEFLVAGDLVHHMRARYELNSTPERLEMAQGLDYLELLDLAKGISAGMDHLHQNSIVHKDLAARNVLIQLMAQDDQSKAEMTKLRVIPKISDFGLATTSKKKRMVPVRWSPPEVLDDSRNSTPKSDVWSFGVVLFELSVACHLPPYPELRTQIKVREYVMDGNKLKFPSNCPVEFVSVADACLSYNMTWRPSFTQINLQLSEMERAAMESEGKEKKGKKYLDEGKGEKEETHYMDPVSTYGDFSSKVAEYVTNQSIAQPTYEGGGSEYKQI